MELEGTEREGTGSPQFGDEKLFPPSHRYLVLTQAYLMPRV